MEECVEEEARIELIRNNLPGLLAEKNIFAQILTKIVNGDPYPDIRQAMMFDNEITLYLDPKRRFSFRMFFFGPDEYTPIHDHNSWGVTGRVTGDLEVVKYRREDDGSIENYAKITEVGRFRVLSSQTVLTLPLDKGIHQTGNPGKDPLVMISVYGSPIRRLYINGFDIEKDRVYKIYSPRNKKKTFASEALKRLEMPGG
jgi:predicted metal-dependent enzyme (double-stranded beta helix superfamily)